MDIYEYLKVFFANVNVWFLIASVFIFFTVLTRSRKLFMKLMLVTVLIGSFLIGCDFYRVKSELDIIKDKVSVSTDAALEHLNTLKSLDRGLLNPISYTIEDGSVLVVSYSNQEVLRYDLVKGIGGTK